MAQINICLKYFFFAYSFVLAILGGILIGVAVLYHVFTNNYDAPFQVEDETNELIVLYVIGAGTMLMALLGASAAYRENKDDLNVFMSLMTMGALLMNLMAPKDNLLPQMEEDLDKRFREFLPLNTSSPEIKKMVVQLQTQLHCCGLFNYSDWNNQFPDSCLCLQSEEDQCTSVDYLRKPFFSYGTELIYNKPCFPIFKDYILLVAKIIIDFYFTLAFTVLLGAVLSYIMIYQLDQPNSSTVPLSDPATEKV